MYQLTRIHAVIRIPDRLEFYQRPHQLRAEHARQQLALGLAVAMLARKRATKTHHQIGSIHQKLAPIADTGSIRQIEIDPRVHAAVTEMPIQRSLIAVAVEQRTEIAQVIADASGIDCRILPTGISIAFARDGVGRGSTALANRPYLALRLGINKQFHRARNAL